MNWQPSASLNNLKARARMLQHIRAFFDARDVLEVETPLMSQAATTDPHLNSFTTRYLDTQRYLNTSPEFFMKRLLVRDGQPIYQVCKSFRDDELGPNHNPEFSLLEWYRPGFSMFQLMDEVSELVCELFESSGNSRPEVQTLRYTEAFENALDLNPHRASAADFGARASQLGIEQPVGLGDDVDGWRDWLLTQSVLPSFDNSSLTYIYDYPVSQCALAKCYEDDDGDSVAARFELFIGELELANGFDELQDSDEQRRRFERENSQRADSSLPEVVIDERFLSALEQGLPACSGVAIGLDRILMLLTGTSEISDVLGFSFQRS